MSDEKPSNPSAYANMMQSVALVSESIPSLLPDKANTQSDYKYISADQIYSAVGQAMAKHGLVVIPSVLSVTRNKVEETNRSGSVMRRFEVDLTLSMTLCDEDGGRLVLPWASIGVDYQSPDKALARALTTGMKYFLKMLFLIGKGNPDGEHGETPQDNYPANYPADGGGGKPYGNPQSQVKPNQPQGNAGSGGSYGQKQAAQSSTRPVSGNSKPNHVEPRHKYDVRNMPLEPPAILAITPAQNTEICNLVEQLKNKTEWTNWMASNQWHFPHQIPADIYTDVVRFLKDGIAKQSAGNEPRAAIAKVSDNNALLVQAVLVNMQNASAEVKQSVSDYIASLGLANPSLSSLSTDQLSHVLTLVPE